MLTPPRRPGRCVCAAVTEGKPTRKPPWEWCDPGVGWCRVAWAAAGSRGHDPAWRGRNRIPYFAPSLPIGTRTLMNTIGTTDTVLTSPIHWVVEPGKPAASTVPLFDIDE